jgi:alpha-beta hydrolase superfamily lysophospholipase
LIRKLSAAFLLALVVLSAQQTPETARKALDLLLASQFSEFSQLLTPAAATKLTPEFLRDHVGPEVKGFGNVEAINSPVIAKVGANSLVSFPVRFSKTTVNVLFTLDESGKVAGLFFRKPDDPLPTLWNRPAYSKPDSFHERPAEVGDDEWKLGGALTVPVGKGPFPAVVLVQGPGPNDRDESIASSRIFADLAEGLASRGIVVLRYDKRTKTYGPQMSSMAYTLKEETIDDAVRALALVRKQPEVDPKRVFIMGHSLGGYAIPRIAKADGKLAGAIFLAANARHIEDISVAQTEYMLAAKGGASPAEEKRLELMKGEAARVRALAPGKDNPQILLGVPVEYFLDLKDYNPVAGAQQLRIPMLFLQGGRDFQVTKVDFDMWKAGLGSAKNVEFHNYPTLNHLFISGDGPSSLAEYMKGGNVSGAVIDDAAAFVEKP